MKICCKIWKYEICCKIWKPLCWSVRQVNQKGEYLIIQSQNQPRLGNVSLCLGFFLECWLAISCRDLGQFQIPLFLDRHRLFSIFTFAVCNYNFCLQCNFCKQLLVTSFVHNFGLKLLFTSLVQHFYSHLLFANFVQNFWSQFLWRT